MRIAVFSDVHGNMDAFAEVMADMIEGRVDEMFCLGDNVGYGPEPEQVLQVFRCENIPSVLGNHDLACIDESALDWFNPLAAESLRITRGMLSLESLCFLRGLKRAIVCRDCRFVHGFPPDSPKTYLFQVSRHKVLRKMAEMAERICFVGHTHELRLIGFDGQKTAYSLLKKGVLRLNPKCRYIVNIGSVGQPRDGNNNAKYVIWDTETSELDVRFVAYDIAAVVDKIRAAGLPEAHAAKLW